MLNKIKTALIQMDVLGVKTLQEENEQSREKQQVLQFNNTQLRSELASTTQKLDQALSSKEGEPTMYSETLKTYINKDQKLMAWAPRQGVSPDTVPTIFANQRLFLKLVTGHDFGKTPEEAENFAEEIVTFYQRSQTNAGFKKKVTNFMSLSKAAQYKTVLEEEFTICTDDMSMVEKALVSAMQKVVQEEQDFQVKVQNALAVKIASMNSSAKDLDAAVNAALKNIMGDITLS